MNMKNKFKMAVFLFGIFSWVSYALAAEKVCPANVSATKASDCSGVCQQGQWNAVMKYYGGKCHIMEGFDQVGKAGGPCLLNQNVSNVGCNCCDGSKIEGGVCKVSYTHIDLKLPASSWSDYSKLGCSPKENKTVITVQPQSVAKKAVDTSDSEKEETSAPEVSKPAQPISAAKAAVDPSDTEKVVTPVPATVTKPAQPISAAKAAVDPSDTEKVVTPVPATVATKPVQETVVTPPAKPQESVQSTPSNTSVRTCPPALNNPPVDLSKLVGFDCSGFCLKAQWNVALYVGDDGKCHVKQGFDKIKEKDAEGKPKIGGLGDQGGPCAYGQPVSDGCNCCKGENIKDGICYSSFKLKSGKSSATSWSDYSCDDTPPVCKFCVEVLEKGKCVNAVPAKKPSADGKSCEEIKTPVVCDSCTQKEENGVCKTVEGVMWWPNANDKKACAPKDCKECQDRDDSSGQCVSSKTKQWYQSKEGAQICRTIVTCPNDKVPDQYGVCPQADKQKSGDDPVLNTEITCTQPQTPVRIDNKVVGCCDPDFEAIIENNAFKGCKPAQPKAEDEKKLNCPEKDEDVKKLLSEYISSKENQYSDKPEKYIWFSNDKILKTTGASGCLGIEIPNGPCKGGRLCLKGSKNEGVKQGKKVENTSQIKPADGEDKFCPDGSIWDTKIEQCICKSFQNNSCACAVKTTILDLVMVKDAAERAKENKSKKAIANKEAEIKQLDEKLKAAAGSGNTTLIEKIGSEKAAAVEELKKLKAQAAKEEDEYKKTQAQKGIVDKSKRKGSETNRKEDAGENATGNLRSDEFRVRICAQSCNDYGDKGNQTDTGNKVVADENGAQCVNKTKIKEKGKDIGEALARAAVAYTLGGIQLSKAIILGNQIDATKKRIEVLKGMKSYFESDSSGGFASCTADDRQNPDAKPRCYCYNDDGSKNTERSKSDICTNEFKQFDLALKNASNYSGDDYSTLRSCFTIEGQQDPGCKCKYVKSTQGENGCFTLNPNKLQLPGMGSSSWSSRSLGQASDLLKGSLAPAKISGVDAAQNAFKMQRFAQKQIMDLGNNHVKSVTQAISTEKKDFTPSKTMVSSYANPTGPNASGAAAGNSLLSSTQSSMMNAMPAAMKDKVASAMAPVYGRSGGSSSSSSNKANAKKTEDNWGGGNSGPNVEGGVKTLEVMNKEFNYKGSDVTNNSSANIFKILSNRYQVSGMRRLFDDEKKAPKEGAAPSDINSSK